MDVSEIAFARMGGKLSDGERASSQFRSFRSPSFLDPKGDRRKERERERAASFRAISGNEGSEKPAPLAEEPTPPP